MDFSTPIRSLQSIGRRRPPLPEEVVILSRRLLEIYEDSNDTSSGNLSTEYARLVLQMMAYGQQGAEGQKPRWEPLAVGLTLANDYLERLCEAVATTTAAASAKEGARGGEAAYFEGPRVPSLTTTTTAPSAPGTTGTPQDNPANTTTAAAAAAAAVVSANLDETVQFCASLLKICQSNLEHDEPRVRSLVAKTVGSHARYGILLPSTMSAAGAASTAPDESTQKAKQELTTQRQNLYSTILASLFNQLAMGRDTSGPKSKDSSGALDDTTGWRSVETNLQAIAAYVNGCGAMYVLEAAAADETGEEGGEDKGLKSDGEGTLLNALRYCSIIHVNRHVRAAGVAVLEQLIGSVVLAAAAASASSSSSSTSTSSAADDAADGDTAEGGSADGAAIMKMLTSPNSALRTVVVDVLKVTLADNWSQVRMAGSVLNRVFLVALLEDRTTDKVTRTEALESLYPILLPRMCLNRFYLAQGVKLYSHETWRLVFAEKGDGVQKVAENAAAVCRYYVKMCDADNHAVREAACQAVAELAHKIGSHPTYAEYLSPYVPMLLQGLLMCFHDESWPVRDEACLACGIFCRAYPEECRPDLKVLFERWTEQLTDQIWSVRENAAVALGDAIVAYGQPMFDEVLGVVKKNLPTARDQPAMTREEYKRRQNDIEAHTNSQLYSCGSLAPKLRKGGAGRIGCCNGALTRERAPWEATDGTIYLVRELCVRCTGTGEATEKGVVLTDEVLLPLMTELADVCRVKHFPQSDDMRATLWRQLPVMANALGKNRFKRQYLQIFMDLLAANLDADRSGSGASQLSVHAAGQCAEELARLVGVSIFRGRLEEDWQKAAFDRAMEDRQRTAGMGPPVEQGFSPFGPAWGIPGAGAVPGAPGGGGVMHPAVAGGAAPGMAPQRGGVKHQLSL